MKKGFRIAGIVAAACIAIILAFAVLAKTLITPERVRTTVLPWAEKALHRKVQLGGIQVSIFSGIVLKDVAVLEKEGEESFLKAGEARLRYQFWPLLTGRVVVDEIRLEAPRIRVVRMPDGTFNYSDMIRKKVPAEEKPPTGQMNLLVSKVSVVNGELRFEDRAGKAVPPPVYAITGIEISSRDVSPENPFPFTVKANISGIAVTAEGKARDVMNKPAVDAVIGIKASNLKKVVDGLPADIAGKIRPFDPSGGISARLHVAGTTDKPKELLKDGEVRLDKIEATISGQRAVLAGDIALTADAAKSSNLTLTAGSNKLNISFTATGLLAKPVAITSAVSADRFDLDPFLKKKKGSTGGNSTSGAEAPPLKLPIRANGTVQLGQTSYKGLPVTGLLLKYRLEGNILTVDELKGSVAGGSFSETARVDLGQPGFAYSTRLVVQGVQADQVVTAFAPKASGTLFGALTFKADLNGHGTQGASIMKNLGGQGDFTVANGKLTGEGLVQDLARFVNLDQLRVIQFSKFAGTFRIEKGKVMLDSAVAGKDVQIEPKGTAGLDKSLDLSLTTRLAPELTGKVTRGDIGKFLTDDKGWGVLPLRVGGTVSSPRFRLDASAVQEQVKTRAKEKIQQTIEEKLLKKKPGEPQRPGQELLEKGLRGIFGK